jgi:hypothetical protein
MEIIGLVSLILLNICFLSWDIAHKASTQEYVADGIVTGYSIGTYWFDICLARVLWGWLCIFVFVYLLRNTKIKIIRKKD